MCTCLCVSFVWANLCWHEGVLPEGKTSFQGLACRYYCYKSDLPHRWVQHIVHTHAHKHTLSQTPLTKGKFYYQPLPDTAPLLQFGLNESSSKALRLVYLVRVWCAYACTCVFVPVFCLSVCVCMSICVHMDVLLACMCTHMHWSGLFAQLGTQIALCTICTEMSSAATQNQTSLSKNASFFVTDAFLMLRVTFCIFCFRLGWSKTHFISISSCNMHKTSDLSCSIV